MKRIDEAEKFQSVTSLEAKLSEPGRWTGAEEGLGARPGRVARSLSKEG